MHEVGWKGKQLLPCGGGSTSGICNVAVAVQCIYGWGDKGGES